MALTIGGDKTPPSSRASAALIHTDAAGGPRAQVQTPKLPYFPQFYFDHLDHGDVPQGPVVPSLLIGKLSTEIAIALEFRL